MTASRFRDLIERRAITFTDCNGALRAIALGICDYLAESTSCPTQLSRMALEGSIIPAMTRPLGPSIRNRATQAIEVGIPRSWPKFEATPGLLIS